MCNRAAMHPRWGKHHSKQRGRHHSARRNLFPPVNIEEMDDKYEISIFAAGYLKEDYKLTITDDILSISASHERKDLKQDKVWQRREFKPRGFERRFQLNEKIDNEAISAKFEEGVVKIILPKKAGFETERIKIDFD